MSWITMAIIAVFFIAGVGYFIVKRLSLNGLNSALKNKDYELVIRLSDSSSSRKLLGAYVCDLYKLRAHVLLKNNDTVRELAKEMLFKEYTPEQHRNFMELYFHIFLSRNDIEMADLFLEEIRKMEDQLFVTYNEYTYEVLVNNRTDLIEDMDKRIEAKLYRGFSLGVLVYLIAMQYLNMGDEEKARIFFEECIPIFHPNVVYIGLAKAQLKKLGS